MTDAIDFKRDTGPFGEPIVIRELTSVETGEPVRLVVGKPRQHPTLANTWFCPWRIEGLGEEPTSGAPGVGIDGWQALEAAQQFVVAAVQGSGVAVNFKGSPLA